MNFDHIILEKEQKDLFIRIVEIMKQIPRENRGAMIEANSADGTALIMPTEKPGQADIVGFARGDLDMLAEEGLLTSEPTRSGGKRFNLKPISYKYYEWLVKQHDKSVRLKKKKLVSLPNLDQFSEALREVLVRIDNLKKELDSFSSIKEEYQENFEKKIRLEWNYHSNKLEGNELSYGETRELLLYEKTSGKSKSIQDHREIIGHDEAISYVKVMAESGEPITEKFIRELNKKVLKKTYKKEAITPNGEQTTKTIYPGKYKSASNHVKTKSGDIFKFAEPQEVPQKMEELINWYRNSDLYPVLKAGEFHYRFVNIHPFDDGNGRVARLLMNYCLIEYGFPPLVIRTKQKEEYHSCLRKADTGEFDPFFQFLGNSLLDSIDLLIQAARGKDINEYSDLDKRLQVFKLALAQDNQDEIREKRNIDNQFDRFDDSIWILFDAFLSKINSFFSFFAEYEIHYLINGSEIGMDDNSENTQLKVEAAMMEDPTFRDLTLEVYLKGFKKGGTSPLNTTVSVLVEFQDYLYVVNPEQKGNNKLPTLKKMYHQKLNEDEIQEYVYSAGTQLMDFLETYYKNITGDN